MAMTHPPRVSAVLRSQWDRALACSAVTAALIVLVLGQRAVATTPFAAEEVAYLISVGSSVLLLVVIAVALLVSAALKDTHHKLGRIESTLRGEAPLPARAALRAILEADADGTSELRPGPSEGPDPAEGIARVGRIGHHRTVALLAGAAVVGGSGVVGAAWSDAAATGDLGEALDALPTAVVGLIVAAAGPVGYALWLRLKVVTRLHRTLVVDQDATVAQRPSTPNGTSGWWAVSGLPVAHRATCPALTFADADRTPVPALSAAGLVPCRLCEPED